MKWEGELYVETYVGWDNIPEKMATKKKLRNEFGLKPCKNAKPCAQVRVQTPRGWRDFDLYHFDDCNKIRKRKINISNFDLNDDQTIADALYIINKSAKVSRDTKKESYSKRNFNVVNAAKTRQLKLYALKDEVIKKLIYENRITLEGYHRQQDAKLLVYRLANRTFHIPTNESCKELLCLGVINDLISVERKQIKGMNFSQAKKLLEKYVGDRLTQKIESINQMPIFS